jgi:maleylpyruvate isomerase
MSDHDRATAALVRVSAAHQALLADLDEPLNPARPSALAGWSVGHVLTHLARNADSVTHRLEAAGRGEHADQYPGGADGRNAEIEAGSRRTWPELQADVTSSCTRLEAVAAGLPVAAWSVVSTSVTGLRQDAATVLDRRVREVVVHHTDLGLSFTPANWPTDLVAELNAELVATLPERAEPHALAGWLTGRDRAPVLKAWS